MRKVFCYVMLASFWAVPAASGVAAAPSNPEAQLLKQRQKQERKNLKLRRKFAKESLRGQNISPALRAERKHQLQKEERALREKQKNERQELKDRARLNRENQKLFGQ